MKRLASVALALALMGGACALAAPVDAGRAGNVASAFVNALPKARTGLTVKSVEKYTDNLYLVNFAPTGYAIVSADDAAMPIVGYGLDQNLRRADLPESMEFMLSEADRTVQLKKNGAANARWTSIENGSARRLSRDAEPVDELIKVKWNQPAPYNKYCPGDGKSKAIVGCVAVAMSQAMSVQKYPAKSTGYVMYNSVNYGMLEVDLDKEPEYNWDEILSGKDSWDAAARLMWHAGMTVEMDYGSDGSGIPSNQTYRISNALKNNFGYPDATWHARDTYRGDWDQLVLNELQAGRAVVYNAIDTKGGYGHSFNVDGYDGDGMFHLNWGWGGVGNGYFALDALKDEAMSMNYDSYHRLVTGIGGTTSPLKSLALSDLIVEEDTPAGTAFAALLVNGAMPVDSDVKVEVTGEYNKHSNEYASVPFKYQSGLLYTTEALQASDEPIYVRVQVTMKKETGVKLTQGFNITVSKPLPLESRSAISYDRAAKTFTVKCKFGSAYTVKNAQGTVVASGSIAESPSFQFSRSQLTPGKNTVELSYGSKTKTFTIDL